MGLTSGQKAGIAAVKEATGMPAASISGDQLQSVQRGEFSPGLRLVCPQGTSDVLANAPSTPIYYSFRLSCVLAHQIEGTQKLLNKDLAELINKMRLAQQNAVTSLSEDCKRQMLTASHTLAVDAKNLLDAVDQAKVVANLAHPPAE